MSKRKNAPVTPEVNLSKLLSESLEAIGEGRVVLAECKQVLREMKEERLEVEALIRDIRDGKVGEHIQDCVKDGLLVLGKTIEGSWEDTHKKVEQRLIAAISGITGIPVDALRNNPHAHMRVYGPIMPKLNKR